jgi:hypothetical protein
MFWPLHTVLSLAHYSGDGAEENLELGEGSKSRNESVEMLGAIT